MGFARYLGRRFAVGVTEFNTNEGAFADFLAAEGGAEDAVTPVQERKIHTLVYTW